jgi:MFS family permease
MRRVLIGTVGLAVGVALTLAAVEATSTVAFFVGTVVAGVGFGAAFQGGIRTVIPLAHPHERAGLLSVVYVVSYLAMGAPAVIGGLLAVHNGDVLTTREYGTAVIVLAVLAVLGLLRRPADEKRLAEPGPAPRARELCEAS